MNPRIDYVERQISEIKNAEIHLYRDISYARVRATIDAFYAFHDLGAGDVKRLTEEARTAYKEWPQG